MINIKSLLWSETNPGNLTDSGKTVRKIVGFFFLSLSHYLTCASVSSWLRRRRAPLLPRGLPATRWLYGLRPERSPFLLAGPEGSHCVRGPRWKARTQDREFESCLGAGYSPFISSPLHRVVVVVVGKTGGGGGGGRRICVLDTFAVLSDS